MTGCGTIVTSLPRRSRPNSSMIAPLSITVARKYWSPCWATKATITTAIEPAAPEIMPGRPPNSAVIVQMKNAPYSPVSGLRCATSAKAMHSGTSAKDVVSPARAFLEKFMWGKSRKDGDAKKQQACILHRPGHYSSLWVNWRTFKTGAAQAQWQRVIRSIQPVKLRHDYLTLRQLRPATSKNCRGKNAVCAFGRRIPVGGPLGQRLAQTGAAQAGSGSGVAPAGAGRFRRLPDESAVPRPALILYQAA